MKNKSSVMSGKKIFLVKRKFFDLKLFKYSPDILNKEVELTPEIENEITRKIVNSYNYGESVWDIGRRFFKQLKKIEGLNKND